MVTAHRVLESLGPGVVTMLNVGHPTDVTGLHTHGDPADVTEAGAIVAAAGADESAQHHVVHVAHERRAAGVVLRAPVAQQVTRAAAEINVTLGALADTVGWVEFISMTDAMLRQVSAPLNDADDAHQQVFRLADEIADLIEAPITVEDVHSQVLAYAAYGEITDGARLNSILGRAVPREIVTQLRAAGTFRRLTTNHEPFTVDIAEPNFLTRLVIPLRVGPELIGSIWAIHNGDLTPDRRHRLRVLGRSLGLLLVRLHARDELSGRYTADRLRAAFRRPDHSTVEELALPAGLVRVMAMGRLEDTSPQDDLRLWRTVLRRHAWADPILTDLEGLVYAIVTDGKGPGSWTWARSLSAAGHIGHVGASRPTASAAELPVRKNEAHETLRAGLTTGHAAVSYEQVWAQVVIGRTRTVIDADVLEGLTALDLTDRERDTLVDTLLTWLLSWGDYNQAGRLLNLHSNTVRQRLRRIIPLLHSVDLADPEQRLALAMVLHSRAQAHPSGRLVT